MLVRRSWWLGPPIGLSLLAGGCGLPPALTVASFAADGVSYAATGKSVTDHGISAATGHDCALLRPVTGDRPVCDTASAHGKDVPVEVGHALVPRPAIAEASAAAPGSVASADGSVAATGQAVPGHYVAIGSFLSTDNAARAAARYTDLHASITPVDVNGRHFHRVIVGPLSAEQAAALKLRMATG